MADIPITSISLLNDLTRGADSRRWIEFWNRYEGVMRGYLQDRFPFVEADDVLQEVLITLSKAIPKFLCAEDSKGHFRNYLIGIVKHKAMDAIRKEEKNLKSKASYRQDQEISADEKAEDPEEKAWKISLMETAIEQLLNDSSISPRNREVFRHVALMHESPESVAELFGITRNNVDQIKRRMIEKLSEMISLMSA